MNQIRLSRTIITRTDISYFDGSEDLDEQGLICWRLTIYLTGDIAIHIIYYNETEYDEDIERLNDLLLNV